MNKNVELLAPAGSFQALVAAVKSGCDAVYLGGKSFSARSSAANFSDEEIVEAVDYCHLRGVKVYVTMNILLDDEEIKRALEFAEFLHSTGVDALIIQDIGLAFYLKEKLPSLELHASTQMTINNVYGAKFLEKMGFSRVVVARETPLNEIKRIKEETNLEIEDFVHGALCVSYSGQCLMSSMIGGRSGNRGDCAQPCRRSYHILNENNKPLSLKGGNYVISPKDLNTIEHLGVMIESGVSSLKIEGRMKRPEYVSQIVSSYRQALESEVSREDLENIEQIFNRGFTKGIPLRDFGKDFISQDRPNNRGIEVGKVTAQIGKTVEVEFIKDIDSGDGLEFITVSGDRSGITVGEDIKRNKKHYFDLDIKTAVNSPVRRTSSFALLASLDDKLNIEDRVYPVSIKANIKVGELPLLEVKSNNICAKVFGGKPVEAAKKNPLTSEKIEEQLSKVGNTVYFIESVDIITDNKSFLPLSSINELRREALSQLDEQILLKNKPDNFLRSSNFKNNNTIKPQWENNKLIVEIQDNNQLRDIDFSKVDKLYIPYDQNITSVLKSLSDKDLEIFIYFNKIIESDTLDSALGSLKNSFNLFQGFRADNLGTLYKLLDLDKTITAGFGLNIFNSKCIEFLRSLGVDSLVISPELKGEQIKKFLPLKANLEMITYGFLPVMTMRHCPMSLVKGCGENRQCDTCSYSQGHALKDEKNVTFRMTRKNDMTQIYNSYPIFLADKLNYISSLGIKGYILNYTFLDEDIKKVQELYYNSLNKESIDSSSLKSDLIEKFDNITYGHLYRGII